MSIRYLSRADVESLRLSPSTILGVVEQVFTEKGHGRVEMPPKPGIHPRPNAFIHAMPASIPALDAAGLKWVSGYPENASRGLPYIAGLYVLNDPATGIVRMVCDCTWITAVRTAAATALAVRTLKRTNASSVALLGLGVQGRSHLDALPGVLDAPTFTVYDVDPSQTERFTQYAAAAGHDVVVAQDPHAAVEGADVIITAGPILVKPDPVIDLDWLKPGALVCPVDFDSYVKPNVVLGADHFYTDDTEQLAYYQTQGYFASLPERRIELADVVVGRDAGRQRDDERIVVMNLGIALEDVAVAKLIFDIAEESGGGVTLAL